ncbi:hypothetical protein Syun_001727 [Stephania yunnanensis]|uniref:Uncharacterized protein n=1 Tax=Stephania yunnanensis TaxID=152371 RepID=A0AAP0LE81_9MAGN
MYMSFRVIGEAYTSLTAKLCPYMWYVPAFRGAPGACAELHIWGKHRRCICLSE